MVCMLDFCVVIPWRRISSFLDEAPSRSKTPLVHALIITSLSFIDCGTCLRHIEMAVKLGLICSCR